MKLCIFGAGAVGGHIAAKLAAAGHEVSVVARGAHLEAMRRDGIRLLHGERTIVGRVRTAAHARELGTQDAVFVTLKANLLGAFAEHCAPLLGRGTAVVFVQNGIPWWYDEQLVRLDPDRALARALERSRIIGAVAYSANEIVAPGVIENHVPGNNMLVIGRPDREETPLVRALRDALAAADMASPAVEDIRQSIWAKLTQNLWTSTLCTLTQLTVRQVQDDRDLAPIAQSAREEAAAIARALGVAIERAPRRPSGKTSSGAAHKPSMLQDYERGRPMEIEAQLNAPLDLARAAKVHTPTLDVLVPLVGAKAAAKGLASH
ncbi:MAG TPA: 2-dehydropantoate 2-reductase [Burkholderiales bacterium]|nr:2-dehydropantoate 2-reductase [Burkholderiales bacterium]